MNSESEQRVGLIGLGLLGSALADRLLAAGQQVCGFDVSSSARAAFAKAGGQVAVDLSAVARSADVLLLCLPNSEIVQQVVHNLTPDLRSGMTIVDTTTGDPETTRQLSRQLSRNGIGLMDATVLGSSQVTREGHAVLLVGADSDQLSRCRHVLESICPRMHHVGPVGSGQQMKLVANLVLGLNRAALAEGLHFARTLGLDLNTVADVLKCGASYSRIMDTKANKMIEQSFEPQARLSQHLKDVRLILQHAAAGRTQLPLSATHERLLQMAAEQGCGDLDNSAVIRAFDHPAISRMKDTP